MAGPDEAVLTTAKTNYAERRFRAGVVASQFRCWPSSDCPVLGQVAGSDALAVSQQIGDAWGEVLLRNTKASPGQHILEAVSSYWRRALACASGRSEILLHECLELIMRDRRHPQGLVAGAGPSPCGR